MDAVPVAAAVHLATCITLFYTAEAVLMGYAALVQPGLILLAAATVYTLATARTLYRAEKWGRGTIVYVDGAVHAMLVLDTVALLLSSWGLLYPLLYALMGLPLRYIVYQAGQLIAGTGVVTYYAASIYVVARAGTFRKLK